MDENPCDDVAHLAGFIVPVGNWIAPDGTLITGEDYETHHWETIKKHLGIESEIDNNLQCMNDKICDGYIRIVIRSDILFQVCGETIDVVWCDQPNFLQLREILERLKETEVHIFSKKFYIVGSAENIYNRVIHRLQIKQ